MLHKNDVNTPNYIWEMETGRNRLEIVSMGRAGHYLREIGRMEEGRWPRIFLEGSSRKI